MYAYIYLDTIFLDSVILSFTLKTANLFYDKNFGVFNQYFDTIIVLIVIAKV